MLKQISWSAFILFLTLALTFYYFFIGIIYFRQELLLFFQRQKDTGGLSLNPLEMAAKPGAPVPETQDEEDVPYSAIHDLLEELKKIFTMAAETGMVKQELLQAIKTKLKSYAQLSGSNLKEDINLHICAESRQHAGIDLSPEDILQIWPS